MRQPIEHGAGQSLAAQNFSPLLEGEIGSHDQRLPFVGAADHLEEEFRAKLTGGDVTQLVEDQQIELRQSRLHPQQRPFFPSFHELLATIIELGFFRTFGEGSLGSRVPTLTCGCVVDLDPELCPFYRNSRCCRRF